MEKAGGIGLKFIDYQREMQRTANNLDETPENFSLGALGLTGEAGEVADYIKKILYHSHELSREKLAEELGDVLWYLTYLTNVIGCDLEEVAKINIEKLRKRYPDGWDPQRSIERE